MPHREAPVESSLSPAQDPLAAFLPWLELREVLRHTLQLDGDVSSACGWPRTLLAAGHAERWLSGPRILCTFSHASDGEQPLVHLALPVDQAVALVDLCLGGSGKPSVPCQAGAPTDAECGVLAYLAARCVRICAPELLLRDVATRRAAELSSWPDGAWLWPLRLVLGSLELELGLIVGAGAPLSQRTLRAELVIRDELEPSALAALAAGDLLLCEEWPGQFTHRGLSGTCELSVPALAAGLRVALEAGQVRALREGSPARGPGRARLVLADIDATLYQLAQLASGQCALPVTALPRARLELDGAHVASGRLVRYGGALALEVGELASMR
jgi:hypothetical protein